MVVPSRGSPRKRRNRSGGGSSDAYRRDRDIGCATIEGEINHTQGYGTRNTYEGQFGGNDSRVKSSRRRGRGSSQQGIPKDIQHVSSRQYNPRLSRPSNQQASMYHKGSNMVSNIDNKNVMDVSNDVFSGKKSNINTFPEVVSGLCDNWALHGNCNRRSRGQCRYRHDLRSVAQVPNAHARGIYAICSATILPELDERRELSLPPDISVVECYTASQDKTVKRWILYPSAPPTSSETMGTCLDTPILKLSLRSTIQLDSACLSVYFGYNCLVAGLSNGIVKIFDRASGGRELTLTGHTSEVHCVKLIGNILLTGDWSGSLRLWTPDPIQKNFIQNASIEVGSPITCFIEVTFPEFPLLPNQTESTTGCRHLWVGCSGNIKVVDLVTLALIRTIQITPDKSVSNTTSPQTLPVVMSLLAIEQHVICCLLSGVIKVYSAVTGEEITIENPSLGDDKIKRQQRNRNDKRVVDRTKRHMCSMTGSFSEDGPVLICGRPHGFVSVLSLPHLEERISFKHHEKDVRAVHNIGGNPSYFITGAFDGSLSVWHWNKPK